MMEILEVKGHIPNQMHKDLIHYQEKIKYYVDCYQDILDRKQSIKYKAFRLREQLREITDGYKGYMREFDVDLEDVSW